MESRVVNRFAVVALLSLSMVVSGFGAPVAGGEIIPPTVAATMDGVPAGEDAGGAQERLRALRHADEPADGGRAGRVAGAAALRSQPVRTPIPFSMVGFVVPSGAEVSFRTSADGQSWSPWRWARALGAADGPDAGTAEAAAAAAPGTRSDGFWVGEAAWLQVGVLNGRPEHVGIDLIDSLGLSRSVVQRAADAVWAALRPAPRSATAAVDRPTVVTREQWGADESLRSGTTTTAPRARMGVVHHTATSNTYSRSDASGVVRAIYRYHTVSNGWSDIGYNVLIDRFGTVYEGRHGGLDKAVVGAHARDWNTGSFGVSVIGCFDSQACAGVDGGGSELPEAAEQALVDVLAWKLDVHSIDVEGTVAMNGKTNPTLVGHRELGATSCPGDLFAARLDDIRDEVSALQHSHGGVVVDPDASPSSVDLSEVEEDQEVTLSAALRPPGVWHLEVTDDDGRLVLADEGAGATAEVTWRGVAALEPGDYRAAFTSPDRRTATVTIPVTVPCEQFCDIVGSVHETAILRLHERGVVNGCEEDRFCPGGRVTRGQMATMTARALELTPSAGGHFTDVPDGHAHADGINALFEHGIVRGDAGRFHPGREVRRDQMATFLHNGLGFTASGASHFSDVAGNIHRIAINALAEHGVTQGDGSGRYLPAWPIRRDQIASLIDRALQAAP